MKKRNKYGAIKTAYYGITFDSKGEAERYLKLREMQNEKKIINLKMQQKFPLEVNGKKVCDYIADFTYTEHGEFIVEDFKGVLTDLFRLKAKLFEAIYGFKIRISNNKSK